MTEEAWLPAPGYHGIYEVSDKGRVRSLDRVTTSVDGRQMHYRGRILRPANGPRGYLTVSLHRGGRETGVVHRLVAVAFLGAPPTERAQVNHKNGRKTDNRVENLEYVSPAENTLHALDTGLLNIRGESSPNSKLTVRQVREIRACAGQVRQIDLARRFGVSPRAIRCIVLRETWRHITSEGTQS